MQHFSRERAIYVALMAGSFIVALTLSWTSFGKQIDSDAYDQIFRLYTPRPWRTESILLAIDQPSLNAYGGISHLRKPLTEALERISAASPKTVAVDLILVDQTDPRTDARLEAAMRATHNLVLACRLLPDGSAWEDPLPRFRVAAALGHVHAEPDELDSVARTLPLEKATGHDRRWALALEAYRVSRGAQIVESPADLEIGGRIIPSTSAGGRLMRMRYRPPSM